MKQRRKAQRSVKGKSAPTNLSAVPPANRSAKPPAVPPANPSAIPPAVPPAKSTGGKLEFYNLEGCPACAIVRDTLDELGLDYLVREVPGMRFMRTEVQEISGQSNVPLLVDPNRDVILPESRDIIAYLREHYGQR